MSATIRIANHTKEQLDAVRWLNEEGYDTVILRLLAITEAVFDIERKVAVVDGARERIEAWTK